MDGVEMKYVVCTACGDYALHDVSDGDLGICSICYSSMRLMTDSEMCDACNNPHRTDFKHRCKAA